MFNLLNCSTRELRCVEGERWDFFFNDITVFAAFVANTFGMMQNTENTITMTYCWR